MGERPYDVMIYGKLPNSKKVRHLATYRCTQWKEIEEEITGLHDRGATELQTDINDAPFGDHHLRFCTRPNDRGRWERYYSVEDVEEWKAMLERLENLRTTDLVPRGRISGGRVGRSRLSR